MATLMLDYGDFPPGFHPFKVKGVLFEFGLHYLLHQPRDILQYGLEYFEGRCNPEKTKLIQDYTQREKPPEPELYEVYPESEIINMLINENPTLQCLPLENLEKLKKLFKRREVEKNEVIIEEGDHYDYFYLVETGTYEAFIQHDENSKPHKVYSYENEGCFGELAFLYLKPRAATIIAKTKGHLWYCDQPVFACLIRKPLMKHRNLLGKFFNEMKCFKKLSPYEKIMMVDRTKVETFEMGDFVYHKEYVPGGLWFVISGSVQCVIPDETLEQNYDVFTYKKGEHFGAFELFTEEVRPVSVIAREESTLATIKYENFLKLPTEALKYFSRGFAEYLNRILDVQEIIKSEKAVYMESGYFEGQEDRQLDL